VGARAGGAFCGDGGENILLRVKLYKKFLPRKTLHGPKMASSLAEKGLIRKLAARAQKYFFNAN